MQTFMDHSSLRSCWLISLLEIPFIVFIHIDIWLMNALCIEKVGSLNHMEESINGIVFVLG